MSLPSERLLDAIPDELQSFGAGLSGAAEDRLAVANASALHEGQMLVRALKRRNLHEKLSQLQMEIAQQSDKEKAAALERFRAVSQELAAIEHS